MSWIVGIDEAGYGPNLGPFTMTSVACRIPDELLGVNLWELLHTAVRKSGLEDDRIVVDDSKQVYDATTGIAGLELGVLATLWRGPLHAEVNLGDFLSATCADSLDDLRGEAWHKGDDKLPTRVETSELTMASVRFDKACNEAGLLRWELRGVVVSTPRFNVLAENAGSKGAVLAHALGRLLLTQIELLDGDDSLNFFIDKHGGRNSYAAMRRPLSPSRRAACAAPTA